MRFQSVVAALLLWAGGGCSGSPAPGGGSGSSSSGGASEGDLGRPLDISVGIDAGGVTSIIPFGGACAANEYEGEAIVADLYIMFDQSGSMATPAGAGTRLAAVRGAVTEFVNSRDSAGLAVGMGYFGYMPIGHTSCQSADYRAPAVPIGALPDNASAIASSLSAITPVGETPTGAAIRGACGYAGEYQRSHPGHMVSLLLVTDGVPEAPVSAPACAPTLSDAAQAAAECRSGPDAIRTYVLGVGPSLDNLKQITAAGGTETTYLVESGNVSAQVLAARQSADTAPWASTAAKARCCWAAARRCSPWRRPSTAI